MAKLSEEEKFIRAEERRVLREARNAEKEALKVPKVVKTEQELVHAYANKIMDGKISRGHFDKRFDWHNRNAQDKGAVNKDIWFDTDFFFSVVFQSEAQKYAFLKAAGWIVDQDEQVQIVNGLELAKKMGIALRPEVALEYPYTDLELRPLVLDSEEC